MEPQEQTVLLIQTRIAQAVVQRAQTAPEVLGEIHSLHHSAQNSRSAAGTIAIDNKSAHARLAGGLDCLVLRDGGRIDQTAFLQFLLQRLDRKSTRLNSSH